MNNIFDEFAVPKPIEDVSFDDIALAQPKGMKVSNKFPILTMPYRIAIIGDAPGEDEEQQGEPFVGMSGKLLTGMLSKAGIVRDACFIGNVCQYRPAGNDISNFSREGDEIQEGLTQLKDDLQRFAPNICLLLGKTALWAFAGHDGIGNWRGSLGFSSEMGYKYISTYHPAACLRQFDWTAYMWFDLLKCKGEAETPTYSPPQYNFKINLSFEDLLQELEQANSNETLLSMDIEGYWNDLKCISFAKSKTDAFIVPFVNSNGSSYWKEESQEVVVWEALMKVLTNPKVPKVWQNGLYDRFVLQYGYNIAVQGNVDDTMLKFAEWLCEIEKGLDVQASILTKQPYWKHGRKSMTNEEFFTYCCIDSVVTYEINEKLNSKLDPAQMEHYRFNNALLNSFLYMELKGIKYDSKRASERLKEINQHIYKLQAKLDIIAGCGINKEINRDVLRKQVTDTMCYKRDGVTPKKEYEDDFEKVMRLVFKTEPLTDEDVGFINIACGWTMNIRSTKIKTFFYTTKGFPKQWKKDSKTHLLRLTTDFEALLKLKKKTNDPIIDLVLGLTQHRTRAQMLSIIPAPDGRMRCSYNVVGSETQRVSSSRSNVSVGNRRVGTNMQTVSGDWDIEDEELFLLAEGLRTLYCANEGYLMFECDLKGSDGWTIGAHLANLGDPTMLDDLKFGLKPASVICYMRRHGNDSIKGKTRPEIKLLLEEVKKEDWDYYCCKQLIWGTCYTMGPRKVAEQILKESYGKIVIEESEARIFQQAVFQRYNVQLWHRWMERKLRDKPELVSPNGHRRRFFGRAAQILGQALAHEPQVNTTYATNLAAWKLWRDPENRVSFLPKNTTPNGRSIWDEGTRSMQRLHTSWLDRSELRIQPLHQVHDSLIGQFKFEDKDWAISKLKEYFNNEIQIAKTKLTIPFSGTYGPNWGDQPFPIK